MNKKIKIINIFSFFLVVFCLLFFNKLDASAYSKEIELPVSSKELSEQKINELENLLKILNNPKLLEEFTETLNLLIQAKKISSSKVVNEQSIFDKIETQILNYSSLFLFIAGIKTLIVIILAIVINRIIKLAFRRVISIQEDNEKKETNIRNERYINLSRQLLAVFVYVSASLFILKFFGFDLFDYFSSDLGNKVIEKFFTIIFVIIFSFIFWTVCSSSIDKIASRENLDRTGNRLRTLLPLAKNALLIIILITSIIIILSELGINIAPLLAGAGIIGLAIGFGAQTLVKDIITGAFIVFENTLSMGDVVDVGNHSGVVEGLTIRTMKLRDLEGKVHTIPFSSVETIINMTKDYSFVVSEIGISYREDSDQVIMVIKEVFDSMLQEKQFNENILDDLEVMGLERFDDSAVIIRLRIKTNPGFQWKTKREFNRRLKYAFDKNNIEIPYPHTTIFFGEDKDGDSPSAKVILKNNN